MSDMSEGGAESAAEPTTPAEGGEPTTTETTQDTGPDLSRLEQRMEEQGQRMQQQMEALLARMQQPEAETEGEEDYLEPGDDGYEDQEAQRLMQEWFENEFKQRMEPIQRQQMIDRRNDEYDALLEEYPEMQDEQFAKPIIARATELAKQLNPDAIHRPEFVDLIEAMYKAQKADERAAREKPAGERKEVVLEGPGGAAPSEPDEDLAARIVAAGNASSELV